MTQCSPSITDSSRESKSKHFLHKFLSSTSPQPYSYDNTNNSSAITSPTTTTTTKISTATIASDDTHKTTSKKNKSIGRRLLKKFTKPGYQVQTVNTPPVYNNGINDQTKFNNNLSIQHQQQIKAQRRRSSTMPSTVQSPIITPEITTKTFTTEHDDTIQSALISVSNNNNNDDDDDDNNSSSDESFVDASEEIDSGSNNNKRASLTQRLSAGRFSSAGGLVVNMHPSLRGYRNSCTNSIMQQQQRLKSASPPDEDLTKAMLEWKRKSDSENMVNKRISVYSQLANIDTTTTMELPLSPAATLLTDPDVQQDNDDDDHSTELSKEAKEASRARAEDILMGNNHETTHLQHQPPTPPSSRRSHGRSRSIKALSEMFSKSLDEAWNNSLSSEQLVEQVRDPRLSNAWTRPLHLSVKAKETAKRIWDGDHSFMPAHRVAEWLGQTNQLNAETLVCYMDLFYFTNMQLDSAFRKLCSKLYFKAEAQQIDRILEVFAHRYWDCNPQSLFTCADVVYAVVYSILLLNTDLHVAKGNHHRMTKQEFINNTMMAVHAQIRQHPEIDFSSHFNTDMEHYLKDLYISVKNYQILQPLSDGNSTTAKGTGLRHVVSLKRGVNSIIRRAGRESMMMMPNEDTSNIISRPVSPLYPTSSVSTTRSSSLSQTSSPFIGTTHRIKTSTSTARRLSRSLSVRPISPATTTTTTRYPNNASLTSIGSSTVSSLDGSGILATDDTTTATTHGNPSSSSSTTSLRSKRRTSSVAVSSTVPSALFTPGTFLDDSPYAKEGVVMCKHLLQSSNQKAKSREWKEQLMVVDDDQGLLKLYDLPGHKQVDRMAQGSFDLLRPTHSRSSRRPIQGPLSRFDPSWNDYLILTIPLHHTLSNVLPPPGYNKYRPHVFALQQPDGGVYLFQGISLEVVASWVLTCNYWAARQSKPPLQGGVGNMDYGWGDCLNNVIVDLDAIQNGDRWTGLTVSNNDNNKEDDDPDAVMIYDWQPPMATTSVSSPHVDDPVTQLATLKTHLHWLHAEINAHRDIKTKMLVKFPQRCFNYKKAMANWGMKSAYLLGDIIKYQHYCDALEKSMQLENSSSTSLYVAADGSTEVLVSTGGALDHVPIIGFNNMDLIKEIETELEF
ncbi:uncharacterized protein BX664DRAFT_356186 [Halteromyces radiatus]|uniref:uncharacterized protein n=1 Tax=Halteromyces radiatus TaxID=101107 RepID=UPI00221F3D87|nr:uncharacterized protein BX664DRAFT_356186 [Halteromyces radiatus]KAI8096876.1 hypothetical protein BX664DRAFT_356186 [Halteromyces radiatus]